MKNIELIIPQLEEYSYEKKLNEDKATMSYNAGYDITLDRYHYDTGCIDFPKKIWKKIYDKRKNENRYFAYIKDHSINKYVGYVNYQYNKNDKIYECGIVIESKYRGKGYAKDALKLLIREANNHGIKYLYDTFDKDRENALEIFKSIGFKVIKEITYKKFNKDVNVVVVRINTNKIIPNINKIKTMEDVLIFMKENIRYGWLDINNEEHIGNMKGFRSLYRTSTLEEILNHKIGTCIEQVYLMKYLLDKINIKNKMFCTRIYEPNNYDNFEEEEHMHCFILCYKDNKVYHIEHPNFYKIGIYEYKNEKEAIKKINNYFIKLSGGISRPVTEFFDVKPGLSFKEFNNYINSLDISFRNLEDKEEDYKKLYKWCRQKFVYEWFEQKKLSYEEIITKYRNKLRSKAQELLIINYNNLDIGFVQIYKYNNNVEIKKLQKYKNVYEYDLFIGEKEYLSKGLGTKIINLINQKIYEDSRADAIVLRPFKRNIRAIKCYEKSNFKNIYEYIGEDTLGNKEDIVVLLNKKSR